MVGGKGTEKMKLYAQLALKTVLTDGLEGVLVVVLGVVAILQSRAQ